VGVIGLVDHDTVALSNLQRQVLFTTDDVGAAKVIAGSARLRALNPASDVRTHELQLDAGNALGLVTAYDLVLDGVDDFDTRFAVNAACVATGRTLVSGAVARWSGQVGVFAGRPCYRCLVPDSPPDAETCAVVGVVGALTGVVGAMMAMEAIKLIAGAGESLLGRLMIYDGLAGTAHVARVSADPACPVCGQGAAT
jgi:molybdopterin/thiamine biosynthesis adenylyltransferase